MRIIREGKLPEEQLFRGTCHNCKTQFECKRHEGDYDYGDQRDGPFLKVKCPKCNKQAFAYPVQGDQQIPQYQRSRYTWDTSIGGDGR